MSAVTSGQKTAQRNMLPKFSGRSIAVCWYYLVSTAKDIFFVTLECALKIALNQKHFSAKNAPNIVYPLGELTALPRPPSCIKGAYF